VIPANISQLCDLMASGRLRIDVVLLQVTGPDAAGNYNAGLGIECLREAIEGARLVIAQLNPALPWTDGDTLIEPGLIDILVPAEHKLVEVPVRTIGRSSGRLRNVSRVGAGSRDDRARIGQILRR